MNRTDLRMGVSRLVAGLGVLCVTAVGMAASRSRPAPEIVPQSGSVVARIGDFAITRDDVARRLLQGLRPHEEEFQQEFQPPTAGEVVRSLLAEKATSMEGRRLGYLQDDQIHTSISQFEQQQIVGRMLQAELGSKLTIDDAEVERLMKENPQATREQAKMAVQRNKVIQLREEFYAQVSEKRGLKKMTENFARAAEIHERLLTKPQQPRSQGQYWIANSQITTDLSDEERNLPLAVYEGGQVTLKDWFIYLCNAAPPRRPKDLGTPQGVERLLDGSLRLPILAAEAQARGYDKVAEVRRDVRKLEDQRLLGKMQEVKTRHIQQPTAEQVKEYYEKDPQRFSSPAVLKADQIWCPNEETARKVKELLDGGADFQTVKKEQSLQKDTEVYSLSAGTEGPFWADLWKCEPNQVVGPMRGFYGASVKWRIVKVLEKTPAQVKPFSEQLGNSVKWALFAEWRQQALKDFEQEMLAKYPHEVFLDQIRDLDVLEIAAKQPDNPGAGAGM
ncbi:MAG: peptidyl-prolyl cis-trans isomerase [Phycisphaerae bacterium]|nr:peptidyl-prolyl cis-trans isomerase [Phycisphaerae bacterium]